MSTRLSKLERERLGAVAAALVTATLDEPYEVAWPLVREHATDSEPEVRAVAMLCIGHLALLHGRLEDAGRALVEYALGDADPQVRTSAEDATADLERFANEGVTAERLDALSKRVTSWTTRLGARETEIAALEDAAGSLPADYLAFLRRHDGGDGTLGTLRLVVWHATEVIDRDRSYDPPPGLVLIGEAGGQALAFDTRGATSCVVIVPFAGMATAEAIDGGGSFIAFLERVAGGYNPLR
ncbi:MAG: hypothetical protein JNL83_05475 [Myxococcales bacterium]|nr:hypothetical protein [Myxococcales bacterium]